MIVYSLVILIVGEQDRILLVVKLLLMLIFWFVVSATMLYINVLHVLWELEQPVPDMWKQAGIFGLNLGYGLLGSLLIYLLGSRISNWKLIRKRLSSKQVI
ncbi:MAG: hypothetical protein R3B84_19650 [Zavarzinella sp.]